MSSTAPAAPATPAPVWPWLVSAGLALFALVPGLARILVDLATDPAVAPTDARSVAAPALIVHAVTGTGFTVLGAFQFPTALRRRGRALAWHPLAGRLLVLLGLTAALSALWLTLFYAHTDGAGDLLYSLRLFFAAALGGEHRRGPQRDQAPRRRPAPGLDDPRLRDRPGREHTDLHPRLRIRRVRYR